MTGPDALAGAVALAARRGLSSIRLGWPGERLAGFALCTDDDLRSLFAVGCTREFLAGRDPDVLFLPGEWAYDGGDECCRDAGRMLWDLADATDGTTFRAHVVGSFRCLVDALAGLRGDGAVEDDVLLVACSTDPGALLVELEESAVRELNPAPLYHRWRQAMCA